MVEKEEAILEDDIEILTEAEKEEVLEVDDTEEVIEVDTKDLEMMREDEKEEVLEEEISKNLDTKNKSNSRFELLFSLFIF